LSHQLEACAAFRWYITYGTERQDHHFVGMLHDRETKPAHLPSHHLEAPQVSSLACLMIDETGQRFRELALTRGSRTQAAKG